MAKEKKTAIIGKVVYTRTDSNYPDVDVEVKASPNGKKITKVVFLDTQDTRMIGKKCTAGDYIFACGTEDKDGIHAEYAARFKGVKR